MTQLSPKEQARAMVEARIQILVDEAIRAVIPSCKRPLDHVVPHGLSPASGQRAPRSGGSVRDLYCGVGKAAETHTEASPQPTPQGETKNGQEVPFPASVAGRADCMGVASAKPTPRRPGGGPLTTHPCWHQPDGG